MELCSGRRNVSKLAAKLRDDFRLLGIYLHRIIRKRKSNQAIRFRQIVFGTKLQQFVGNEMLINAFKLCFADLANGGPYGIGIARFDLCPVTLSSLACPFETDLRFVLYDPLDKD